MVSHCCISVLYGGACHGVWTNAFRLSQRPTLDDMKEMLRWRDSQSKDVVVRQLRTKRQILRNNPFSKICLLIYLRLSLSKLASLWRILTNFEQILNLNEQSVKNSEDCLSSALLWTKWQSSEKIDTCVTSTANRLKAWIWKASKISMSQPSLFSYEPWINQLRHRKSAYNKSSK